MCGRYSLTTFADVLEERFGARLEFPKYQPRYNAAPSQMLPVILNTDPKRIVPAFWGFIPSWYKDPEPSHGVINARAETLSQKAFFRSSFEKRRCLVLADGFFEWQAVTRRNKIPHWITLKNKGPFAFAGIWSLIKVPTVGELATFAIVTCEPNFLVSQVHDRMPVILERTNEHPYLEADLKTAASFFVPYPNKDLVRQALSPLVNSPANDRPEILEPAA